MERSIEITELLAHAGWVRALARRLTADDAAADDLVQETWLAALKHPPRMEERTKPWLAEVLRNARRMGFRRDTRRTHREQVAAPDDPGGANAEQLAVEVELGRKLAEEVLALDEPYRETLLLHYYRGLSSAEIGAQLAIAAGTARWRLKEGVARPRIRLDRVYDGDRGAWIRALAPLAGAPLVPRVPTAASAAKGATMVKIFVAALATAGVAGAVYTRHAAPPVAPTPSSAPAAVVPVAPANTATTAGHVDKAALRRDHDALLQRITDAQKRAAALSGVPTGTLDREYISASIRELMPRIKWCYEQSLLTQPTLSGRILMHFTITADPELGGIVSDSKVDKEKSTIAEASMQGCLEQVIYDARFPPPTEDGDVEVDYPFVFEPAAP